jgi:hypothetical protein
MPNYFLHINTYLDRTVSDSDTSDVDVYLYKKIITNGKVKLQIMNIELPNLAYTFGPSEYIFYYYNDYAGAKTLSHISLDLTRNFDNGNTLVAYMNSVQTDIIFSYNSDSKTISATNNTVNTIKLVSSYRYSEDSNIASDCADRLGFDQDMRNGSTWAITAGSTLEGSTPIKLLRTNCYYLVCDKVGNSNQQSTTTGINRPNILARCSANNFGYLSSMSFANEMDLECSENQIDKLHFTLLDDKLYPISLNNASITMTLKISIV